MNGQSCFISLIRGLLLFSAVLKLALKLFIFIIQFPRDEELFPVQSAGEAYAKLEKNIIQRDNQIELMLSQLSGGMMIGKTIVRSPEKVIAVTVHRCGFWL
jgi:hypothetical protein